MTWADTTRQSVQMMSQTWERMFQEEGEDVRKLINLGFVLIARRCIPECRPKMFDDSHVIHAMAEFRKFHDHTQRRYRG